MEKNTFDELIVRFCRIENKFANVCRPTQDVGLKKWMDNQDVCETLRISKRTLQVYRDKGLIPFSRIKHKFFYRPEDVLRLLKANYHPQTKKL